MPKFIIKNSKQRQPRKKEVPDRNPHFKYDEELEGDVIEIKGKEYISHGVDIYDMEGVLIGKMVEDKLKLF